MKTGDFVNCFQCDRSIYRQKHLLKKTRHFCSVKCLNDFKKGKSFRIKNGTYLICKICNNEFYLPKYRLKKENYCSKNCKNKSLIGKKITKEHKLKISNTNKGNKYAKGYKHSLESRNKMSISKIGILRFNELQNIPIHLRTKERQTTLYKNWRNNVLTRDNRCCKINNEDCFGRIEVHHILGWSSHPELRYKINNGITLCHFHHPRKREDEKRLASEFQKLVSVSKV